MKGTLIKVIPVKRYISTDTVYDSILMYYRDEHGVKKCKFVDRAKVPFYILKDKNTEEARTPPMFIEKNKVDKITVYSDVLYREIALRTDSMSFYDKIISNYPLKKQTSNLKNLLKHNYIYDADMNISDRYIKNFNEEFEANTGYKLHKIFFDIEVDLMSEGFVKNKNGSIGYVGFPKEDLAPCPVNIITIVDSYTNDVYTLTVNNKINNLQQDFNSNIEASKSEILEFLESEHGFIPNSMNINVYETEEECIVEFFKLVHKIDPDFACAWNQSFDVITLMNRLIKIYNKKPEVRSAGISGKDKMISVVCDPKSLIQKDSNDDDVYLSPFAYYIKHDEQAIVDRMDTCAILDGINWIDQMLLFANVRKTSGLRESYSLDAIANEELGKEKLDYTGYTIKNLAWLNYMRFVKYNISDVVLLHLLEEKNLDLNMLQSLSDITNTRKEKVFKKTISLKNFVCKFAEQQNYVMGNNKNAQYGDEGEYFEANFLDKKIVNERDQDYLKSFSKKENFGAYVGDPNLNDYCGIEDASGNKSMFIFEHVFDEDFSSLYPSIIRAYNLDKNTQVGKFFLLDKDTKDNLITNFGYAGLFATSKNEEANSEGDASLNDLGPTIVDSLVSQDWSRIGQKYFGLPSAFEIINKLKSKKE